MRKNVLLAVAMFLLTFGIARAQFNYDVSVSQQTYVPLTGATSINGNTIWDDDLFMVPLGFTFELDKKNISDIAINGGVFAATDTEDVVDMFLIAGADLHDRGNITGTASLSPISYKVEGAAGSRIFKMEVANAGFWDEWDLYTTDNDSVNYQIWFYETSNIVELRFGPSNISHPADYFLGTGKPLVGFFRQYDLNYDSTEVGYVLTGDPSSPVIDSFSSLDSLDDGLNAYPPNGTVYKFAPKSVSVKNITHRTPSVKMLSNIDRQELIIINSEQANGSYRILNTMGMDMRLKGNIAQGNTRIDISVLPAGNYVLYSVLPTGTIPMRFTKY